MIRERGWEWVYENVSTYHQYISISIILHLVFFWSICFAFMFVDLTQSPKFIYKYKIQKNKKVTFEEYKRLMKIALSNLFFVALPLQYILYYSSIYWPEISLSYEKELPSILTTIFRLISYILIEEITFYYIHYFFHLFYYKKIHKFHHKFTAPVAMACVFAHPLEHLFANLTPLSLGPLIIGGHITDLWLWLTIAVISTMLQHSGYSFPFSSFSIELHDYHHETFTSNYGAIGLMDFIHRTYRTSSHKKLN